MPQKSSILKLPKAAQEKLRRLYETGCTLDELHGGLVAFLEELDGKWQVPSRSAIHRDRQNFEAISQKMREAREIASALAKDMDGIADDKTADLLVELLRTLIFKVLQKNVESDKEEDAFNTQEFMFLAKALKDIASASAINTKQKQEIRTQARKEAAEAVSTEAKKRGFDKETVKSFFDIASGKVG